VASLLDRFYDRVRDPASRAAADERRTVPGFDHLDGHKYCTLVTYRRSGEPVPTPVWFGLQAGALYVRTDAAAAKVRRIRADPRVRVAPANARGRPLGPAAEGRARVLGDPAEEARAEAALQADYGLARKAYERIGAAQGVYLEIVPA
jgi:PPOX class probable F420-dependent enzyme